MTKAELDIKRSLDAACVAWFFTNYRELVQENHEFFEHMIAEMTEWGDDVDTTPASMLKYLQDEYPMKNV